MQSCKVFSYLLIVLLSGFYAFGAVAEPVAAQDSDQVVRLSIDEINDTSFPYVEAYVSVLDTQGFPIQNLVRDEFSISEDGQAVNDFAMQEIHDAQTPLSVVLAVDTSQSMLNGTPTPLEQSVEAAKGFVSKLADHDQVAIVSFSDEANVVLELTNDKNMVMLALDTLKAQDNTAMFDAMVTSVELLKGQAGRKAVVLLADGKDNRSQFSVDEAINEAVRWAVPVYPIGFGQVNEEQLQKMGQMTGGTHQVQPDPTDLETAFNTILDIFREQYQLTFTSSLAADGKEHSLLIDISHQGWQTEFARQFVAHPGEVTVSMPGFENDQVIWGEVRFVPEVLSPADEIAQLDVSLDGEALESVYDEPFDFIWDSTTVEPGPHELTFVMTDTAGNIGEMTLPVMVEAPLTIVIETPVDGENVSGQVAIVAQVDAKTEVEKVEFFINDDLAETVIDPPYQYTWMASRLKPGDYMISATATDENNYSASSEIGVSLALQQGSGIVWMAVLAAFMAVLLVIPLSLRKRRRMKAAVKPAAAVVVPPSGRGEYLSVPIAASGTGIPTLVELEGLNPDQRWQLSGESMRLGRKRDENEIVLDGARASRRHAEVRMTNGQWIIYSLNPDNPVVVNQQPVQQHTLRSGDIVQMGDSVFRYEA